MATGPKKGGDMVLGGRHLAGIFIVLVMLFAAVFTLGYLLGRNETETQARAGSGTPAAAQAAKSAADKPAPKESAQKDTPAQQPTADWDFYHEGDANQPSERLVAQPKPIVNAKAPVVPPVVDTPAARRDAARVVAAKDSGTAEAGTPPIPRGATVLQVAALARQDDATALAQALQQKKFPAFVLNPSADHYYRVQIGPYANAETANAARKRLDAQGFKSIVKR